MKGDVAAYVRVSSKSQTAAMQRAAIERAAAARGDEIATWYAETVTGGTMRRDDRPELERLRGDVRQAIVRRIYVFRIDRLSRTGPRDVLELVEEIHRNGCELVSIGDPFDLTGPMGEAFLMFAAWHAKVERATINERIAAARERVEREGGRWGRPRRLTSDAIARCRELAAEGRTVREIAQAVHMPRSTVQAALSRKGPAEKYLGELAGRRRAGGSTE